MPKDSEKEKMYKQGNAIACSGADQKRHCKNAYYYVPCRGNASLTVQKIIERLPSEKQQRLL